MVNLYKLCLLSRRSASKKTYFTRLYCLLRQVNIDILELLAAGLSFEQILEELPDLELEDIKAALLYAVRKLDHPVLAA